MGGMPGMGGQPGMGGAAGSGGQSWSETPGPPELSTSYEQFLANKGLPRAPIPPGLLKDASGQPVQRTENAWGQLHDVYAGAKAGVGAGAAAGAGGTGSKLLRQMQTQLAVIRKENAAVEKSYKTIKNGFWFEVGYPQYNPAAVSEAGVTVTVGVIMHVKPSLQQSLGSTLARALKPYDNYGTDRQPFVLYTYQGGFFHPQTYTLHPSTMSLWQSLWGATQLQLKLKDRNGQSVVASSPTTINLGDPTAVVMYPPEIRRTPYFAYVMPTEDLDFTGSRKLNLDFSRGWYYQFSFPMSLEDIARLHKASVELLLSSSVSDGGSTVVPAPTGAFPGGMPPGAGARPAGGPPGGAPSP